MIWLAWATLTALAQNACMSVGGDFGAGFAVAVAVGAADAGVPFVFAAEGPPQAASASRTSRTILVSIECKRCAWNMCYAPPPLVGGAPPPNTREDQRADRTRPPRYGRHYAPSESRLPRRVRKGAPKTIRRNAWRTC